MSAYYTRDDLERLIKKEIPTEIRNVIIDLLAYLDNKGINIARQIIRVNKADFMLLENDNVEYEYEYKGSKNKIQINKKEISGFYKPITVYDAEKEKFVLCNELIVVKKREYETEIRGKIIHELLHLLSSKLDFIEIGKESLHYSGISKYMYTMENNDIEVKYFPGETYINEAITEALRYGLMKEIYNVQELPFATLSQNKRKYKFNSYYLNTNLITILNLGVTRTTSIDILLDVYLNNKREYFYSNLEKNFNMDKEEARDIFFTLNKLMQDFFKYNIGEEDIKIMMKADMYPLYQRILFSFYKNIQNKEYTKDERQTINAYLEQVEIYLSIYFSYPLLNTIKEDIIDFVSLIRESYN